MASLTQRLLFDNETFDADTHAAPCRSAESMGVLSDEALMVHVRENCEVAYRILLERHVDGMTRLATRIVGDHAAAEDVVQDAFLQVWVKRGDWRDGGAKFTTWLYRVVYNRCIDFKRRRREAALDEAGDPADDRPDAVSTIQRGEVASILREAMLQLPEAQYVTLTMYYHEGLSAKELAQVQGVSLTAIESLLKRGRKNLREQLKSLRVDVQYVLNDP